MNIVKNQKGLAHLGVVILFLLVIGGVGGTVYYVFNKNKSEPENSSKITSGDKNISIGEFVSKVEAGIKTTSIDKLSSVELLKSGDDFSGIIVADKDGRFTTAKVGGISIKLTGKIPDTESDLPEYILNTNELPQLKTLDEQIAKAAAESGLEIDQVNTRKDIDRKKLEAYEEAVVNYSGYKNDNFICVLSEPSSSYGGEGSEPDVAEYTLFFGCVDWKEYDDQRVLQKELLTAHIDSDPESKQYYNSDKIINETLVGISKQTGDFIYGGIGSVSGGGGYGLWKKVNNKWKFIVGGQEVPGCSKVDGQGIPKDFLPDNQCYDEKANNPRSIKS